MPKNILPVFLTFLALPAIVHAAQPVHMRAIAHRGIHGPGIAQNSVESFKTAFESGARWIETDFHYLKNGRILCVHDRSELKRISGVDRVIADLSEADVAEINIGKLAGTATPVHMPYLEDVMAVIPKGCIAQCEIKLYAPEYAEKFDAAVKHAGLSHTNILVTSFNAAYLKDFSQKCPAYETLLLIATSKEAKPDIQKWIATARDCGVKYICPGGNGVTQLTRADADAIRAAGFEFRFYGVNSEERLKLATELGVTAFTCDHWKESFNWAKSIPGLTLTP